MLKINSCYRNKRKNICSIFASTHHEILELKVKGIGNNGFPVLDHIEDQLDYFVIEVSSFQIERTKSLSSLVSVLLNIL